MLLCVGGHIKEQKVVPRSAVYINTHTLTIGRINATFYAAAKSLYKKSFIKGMLIVK